MKEDRRWEGRSIISMSRGREERKEIRKKNMYGVRKENGKERKSKIHIGDKEVKGGVERVEIVRRVKNVIKIKIKSFSIFESL